MVERIGREEGKLLARDELQRAIDELNAARVLHENKFYYKSISTAYYSVYHAAKAALLLKGIASQSHEGVVRMFSLYYVKVNEISIDTGKILGRLMKLREEADYYPETSFSCDDSQDTLGKATMFIENIQKIVKKGYN